MTVPLPTPAPKDASTARKRRRRAPAGGAADDCFTCTKRSVKCDRRRPYCSQCLEIGNECSGYKTQLTWGVGVASRGKLRGLSLPIAKAPPVGVIKKTPSRPRAGSSTASVQWSDQGDVSPRTSQDEADLGPSPEHAASSMPGTPFHGFEFSQMAPQEPTSAPAHGSWTTGLPFSTSLPTGDMSRFPHDGRPHLSHLIVSGEQLLSSSVDSLSDVDYMSPLSHSFPHDDVPFLHSPAIMYHETFTGQNSPVPQSPIIPGIMMEQRPPTSCPSLIYSASEPSSSLHSQMEHDGNIELDGFSAVDPSRGAYWTPSTTTTTTTTDEDTQQRHSLPEQLKAVTAAPWPSLTDPQPVPIPINAELLTRMPFFLDYYSESMCNGMVFIDGPGNPFRDHIMSLAATSRSLQHAICALAACNLRMKRKLSLGQHDRDLADKRRGDSASGTDGDQPEDQSLTEEYQHRNLAVQLLNEQLNDAANARHDSVLATILILCHYRMAESGIAKFHTQFAGVKKILGMRRSSAMFPLTRGDSAWMEALFTYFDAISASINDREAQLNTSFYGVMPDAQLLPPGAENLVGCDRELFKTIIKLGRLNLLSQHRSVSSLLGTHGRGVPSRSQSPLDASFGHAVLKPSGSHLFHGSMGGPADLYGSSPQQQPLLPQQQQQQQQQNQQQHQQQPGSHPRFDGNGFGTTLDDEEIFTSAVSSSAAYDDHRSTFWREWKDARIALQSWEFDAQRAVASLLPLHPTPGQVRDLGSLSEAFRYAALLYTERLASPNVPSAHSNFRNLVSQVVYYATSLEAGSSAEKFLLWPLFVAGSECVNELQQNIVRSKCREIMARSGYMNNLTALDVLERLWAGDWKEDGGAIAAAAAAGTGKPGGCGARRGPFNWTRCIGGPGVEVEWIMF